MKTPSEYLEQAARYESLAREATKERRRIEQERLAELYRYFAEEAAAMHAAAATHETANQQRSPNTP